MYNFTQTEKLDRIEEEQDKILRKLYETWQQNEHTLFGEALATIVDNLIQRKTEATSEKVLSKLLSKIDKTEVGSAGFEPATNRL